MKAGWAFASLLLGSCAHIPASEKTSLILAEWRDAQNFRDPPGCNEPDVICMNVLADVGFGNVHTLSGPRLPDRITATISYHSEPRRDLTLLAAVKTDESGHRTAWRLDFVMPTEAEACFDHKAIEDFGVIVPKAAVRRGDQYCIALV